MSTPPGTTCLVCAILWAIVLAAPDARADTPPPPELLKVDIVEHLGAPVPGSLSFRDSQGQAVRLGSYFASERPVVLTLAYLECPMLCSLVLSGVARGLESNGLVVGKDVDLLTVSFNPADGPALATEKRRQYLSTLGIADAGSAWPFLTGAQPEIDALARSLGFVYSRIAHTSEFAHAAVVFVLTPSGVISRYLYGAEPSGRDLRLSIAEAAQGHSVRTVDRFLLHCYRYDPATRRYGLYIKGFFRAGGALILAALLVLLSKLWRQELARTPQT